jgi:preprotein translocase subunit SecB
MKENPRENDPKPAPAKFSVQKIYIKDLSFESPRPVESLLTPLEGADVNFELGTESRKLEGELYEVVLTITVTIRKQSQALYLIEVKQAGLFGLAGLQPQELAAMLNAYCPNLLFPYAREVVCTMAERGGFPQLLLKPVNFDVIYRQYLRQKAAGAAAVKA